MNSGTPVNKILILAASPKDRNRVRLEEELRDIEEGLQRAKKRDQFLLKPALAVRTRDIHRQIMDFEPQIVHFSGHGEGEDGLVFEDVTGKAKLVNAEALAGLFELFTNHVKCVVLNACYSEFQAEAIALLTPKAIALIGTYFFGYTEERKHALVPSPYFPPSPFLED
jgi:CHAT domain